MILDYYACPEEWKNGVSSKHPGAAIGSLGFWSNMQQSTFNSYEKRNRGYPGQDQACGIQKAACGVRVWGDATYSGTTSGSTVMFSNGQMYTSPGMSGSAVFVNYGLNQYVIGVNSYKNTYNSAYFRRITSTVSDFIFAHSPDYTISKVLEDVSAPVSNDTSNVFIIDDPQDSSATVNTGLAQQENEVMEQSHDDSGASGSLNSDQVKELDPSCLPLFLSAASADTVPGCTHSILHRLQ